MGTSTFVAYPTGNADITIQVNVVMQGVFITRETMYNNSVELLAVTAQYLSEIFMRIPFMEEHRQSRFYRKLNMRFERFPLGLAG